MRGRALTLPLLGSEKRHPLLFLQGKFTAHAARTAHNTIARGRTELNQVEGELVGHVTGCLASDIISSYKGER